MKLSDGQGIVSLIRLVSRTPQSYRRLILCAPFISEGLLKSKIAHDGILRIPTLVITRPETARSLVSLGKSWKGPIEIAFIRNLHAKVYIACGKQEDDSVAVIGSFNLTAAALESNFELGLRLVGNSPQFRQIIFALESQLIAMAELQHQGAIS